MTAEDVDSHANGDILYSIVNGDRENQFFIEPITGQIKVNKQLDRETVRNVGQNPTKTLFQMTDQGTAKDKKKSNPSRQTSTYESL